MPKHFSLLRGSEVNIDPFDDYLGYSIVNDGRAFTSCLPDEAARMSSTGIAVGVDLMFYGESYYLKNSGTFDDPGERVVAMSNGRIVRYMLETGVERKLYYSISRPTHTLDDDELEIYQQRKDRVRCRIRKINTYPWEELTDMNRDYLLSLLWLPEKLMSPLEILANVVGDENDA